ncbi:Uncharacterised protein [Streptococcus pneumoniae]|nr:Uncharacterised protein [Streptococcus pneumoniae]
MILRILNYVNKYQKKKLVSWPTNQLLFDLSNYRFSDFFTANTSEVACDINGF